MAMLAAILTGFAAALILFAAYAVGYWRAMRACRPGLDRLAAYERRRDVEFNHGAPEWLRQQVDRVTTSAIEAATDHYTPTHLGGRHA